jgi:hypothetical protein
VVSTFAADLNEHGSGYDEFGECIVNQVVVAVDPLTDRSGSGAGVASDEPLDGVKLVRRGRLVRVPTGSRTTSISSGSWVDRMWSIPTTPPASRWKRVSAAVAYQKVGFNLLACLSPDSRLSSAIGYSAGATRSCV